MNVLYEFDAKRQSELDRRDGIEEGRKEGRKEGRIEGRIEGRKEGRNSVIKDALKNGSSPEDISRVNGIPLKEVKRIQEEILTKI